MAIDTLGANALASNSVTSAKIADDAVVAADITDGSVTTAKLAADAVTAAKLADNAVVTANVADGAVTAAKTTGVGKGKNVLINGSFNWWQRGTSFSSNVYGADRWKFYAPGGHAYAQSTDTPDSPNNFKYSASVGGSGDATGLTQFVEQMNCVHFPSSGSTKVILSFYLKHTTNSGTAKITSVVGTMDSADNSGASTNRSTKNHDTTTSWARYTHEMTGADLTAAVTNGLVVTIKHNGSGTTAFLLTGCQLEVGESVTDFERRGYGEELLLCQRYYCESANNSGATRYFGILQAYASSAVYGVLDRFPVQMRAIPTVTQSGSWGGYQAGSGGAGLTASIQNLIGTSYSWNTEAWGGGSGLTAGHASVVYAINGAKLMADAEL